MLSQLLHGPWINVVAIAVGLLLVVVLLAISRRGPKKTVEHPPRTEEQARAAQLDRDRLANRR